MTENTRKLKKTRIMKTTAIMLAAAMCFTASPISFAADNADTAQLKENDIKVYVNDELITFDAEPEIIDGSTFVPMRQIFEAIGADVTWSDARKEVVADYGLDEVVLKIGSKVAINNTNVSKLNTAPYIKNERTMVPLRYLSESLGYNVGWDGSAKKITIDTVSQASNDNDKEMQTASNGDGVAVNVLGENAGITYNDAMKKAIKNSNTCQNALLNLSKSSQQMDEFYDLYTHNYNIAIMQNRKSLKLMNNWYEKNVVVSEEQTAYVATTDMDAISLKLIDIKNQESTLEYAKKTYNTNKLKYDVGTLSAKELKSSQDDVTSAEKTLANYKTELDALYIKLYGSLGLEQGDYDTLEFYMNYEPIGEVDIQKAYTADLSEDPYIWLLENTEDNAKFVVDTYEYNQASKSYTLTTMDLTQARQNLSATKTNLMTTLNTRYNQIIQVENNIDMLQDKLETLRDGIDTLRTTYEAGASTKQTLEDTLQNERTITYNLLSLKISHQQLVDIFEKPYLSPTYVVQ